ncbi:hypothetical protein SAMN04488109_1826 [Chryseolinea serpens]|uniref:Uncharacterized protein n=1 Tax=Chryseolinea serpens TaxID=947013 RepID=A0A1M5MMQ3_9BACT|nr:hypothetical protein [Chryseolinea serpens]SHG78578.1 hypothetical protein SAMN04488109_1826 [Chryseolinea serpens]
MDKSLEFCEEPAQVFSYLFASKVNNSMIGVNSEKLDPPTCIAVVKEIVLDGHNLFVLLSPFDTSGQILNCTLLRLSDIQGVLPFTSKFINPFLKKIEGTDSWLQQLYFSMFPDESNPT